MHPPRTALPDPRHILRDGCAILDPLLREHGFSFVEGDVGVGSGGDFARGAYVRGDRRLDLSVRQTLGLVAYSATR